MKHKNKRLHRIISVVLATVMTIGAMPMNAFALGDGVYYEKKDIQTIAEGVTYEKSSRLYKAGWMDVYVLTMDANSSDTALKVIQSVGSVGIKTTVPKLATDNNVIAAVNGFALGGGCEISMSCDIRICSENAMFGQPEAGLGITPGFGGTQRLARIVGPGKAKQLIYTARNIKAAEAYRIGLVNEVYPLEELMPQAKKMAKGIAKNAPIAVRACKKAINEGLEVGMDEAIVIEEKLFGSCFETEDQKYGMAFFLDKNKEKVKEPFKNC